MAGKRTSRSAAVAIVLIVSAFAALAIYCVWLGQDLSADSSRLAAAGLTADATITEKAVEGRANNGAKSGLPEIGPVYVVGYTYADGTGTVRFERKDVSVGFYNSLAMGQVVPVRFTDTEPPVSEVEPGALGNAGWQLTMLGLAAFGAGVLMGGMPLVNAWAKRRGRPIL